MLAGIPRLVGFRCVWVLAYEHEHRPEDNRDYRGAVVRHRPVWERDPDDQRSQQPDAAQDQHDSKAACSQTKLAPQASRPDRQNRQRDSDDYEQT